jgi:IS30 family transposase
VVIADGAHAGKSARKIAAELACAVSMVSPELQRNQSASPMCRLQFGRVPHRTAPTTRREGSALTIQPWESIVSER